MLLTKHFKKKKRKGKKKSKAARGPAVVFSDTSLALAK